jgi:IclR helix-turn-helix domain
VRFYRLSCPGRDGTGAEAESLGHPGGSPVTLAQRRAADWARTVIDRYGVPHAGRWLIPLSQAQLAEEMGWARNGGTVATYLTALGPVVRQRRGGIALDPQRLTDLENHLATPPATTDRTDQVARDLSMRLGHPTPNGTTLMIQVGNDYHPASLADMASLLGLHRSTVHRHLERLTAAGRLTYHDGAWTFPPPSDPSRRTAPDTDRACAPQELQDPLEATAHRLRSLDQLLRPSPPA